MLSSPTQMLTLRWAILSYVRRMASRSTSPTMRSTAAANRPASSTASAARAQPTAHPPWPRLGIGDRLGAIHDGAKHRIIDVAGPNLGEPIPHGPRVMHVAAGHPQTDAQRRGHLRTHRRPGIHRPIRLFAALDAAQLKQLP